MLLVSGRRSLVTTLAAARTGCPKIENAAVFSQYRSLSAGAEQTDPLAGQKDRLKETCAGLSGRPLNWVFLGAPGVGKGTYVSRLSKILNIPHISAGDLVRDEIKRGSPLAKEMDSITKAGKLLPDEIVLNLLKQRLDSGRAAGEMGCLLDGFPRTRRQAEMLDDTMEVHQAINFTLREDVLVLKCCGRRVCGECGKNYNTARIDFPATAREPAIFMPPLDPPEKCRDKMQTRSDDTEEVVRKRLAVYNSQCGPVEDFYRAKGLLVEFPILAGIPETMPRLLSTVTELVQHHVAGRGAAAGNKQAVA